MNSRFKELFIQSRPEDIICVQEIWGANLEALKTNLPKSRFNISQRVDRRGGGSLTILENSIQVHKIYPVNKDSNLLRTIVHGNKVLWLCNAYLNTGKVSQIQKLFRTLLENIPKEELNRVVVIGDLNVNIIKKDNEKFKLLKTLAAQIGLEIVEPDIVTFRSSKLDFAMVSKGLNGKLTVDTYNLSDHSPIVLKISSSIVNKDCERICLPNSKLAKVLTTEVLCNATNARSFLQIHRTKFQANSRRAMKRIKRKDYERKLFALLTEKKNVAISEVIRAYWTDLLNENEKLRYSLESAKAESS